MLQQAQFKTIQLSSTCSTSTKTLRRNTKHDIMTHMLLTIDYWKRANLTKFKTWYREHDLRPCTSFVYTWNISYKHHSRPLNCCKQAWCITCRNTIVHMLETARTVCVPWSSRWLWSTWELGTGGWPVFNCMSCLWCSSFINSVASKKIKTRTHKTEVNLLHLHAQIET